MLPYVQAVDDTVYVFVYCHVLFPLLSFCVVFEEGNMCAVSVVVRRSVRMLSDAGVVEERTLTMAMAMARG